MSPPHVKFHGNWQSVLPISSYKSPPRVLIYGIEIQNSINQIHQLSHINLCGAVFTTCAMVSDKQEDILVDILHNMSPWRGQNFRPLFNQPQQTVCPFIVVIPPLFGWLLSAGLMMPVTTNTQSPAGSPTKSQSAHTSPTNTARLRPRTRSDESSSAKRLVRLHY